MRVLIGCEQFGVLREAMRRRGHDAWSCDLKPARDGSPYHIQGDVLGVIEDGWDLAIFHPDCTYLTNSAAWAYGDGPYHQKVKPGTLVGANRRQARSAAIRFTLKLWHAPIPRVAIENPVGCLSSSSMGKPAQIIQPWQFGDDASKGTCLWLKGLLPLRETQVVPPRIVDGRPRWANQTDGGQNRLTPSDDRAMQRAATYLGIADAMADQWAGPIFANGNITKEPPNAHPYRTNLRRHDGIRGQGR
jgi:hypothetical protein